MKRIPRKKKKAMKVCTILHSGNPACHKLAVSKVRWVRAWSGYKSTANTLMLSERREANQVKIKNLDTNIKKYYAQRNLPTKPT